MPRRAARRAAASQWADRLRRPPSGSARALATRPIRLEALVAARLSAGPTGGFRATTSLATDRVLPGGAIDRGGLRVSDPEVVRWPSPDPVTQSLTVPCLPEGSPLYYRLDNNVYGSQVDQVTVQAQIDFVLAGATVKQIAVGAPFDLLGEGNTIAVTATHNSLVPQIGTVSADERGPWSARVGPPAASRARPSS